MKKFLLLCSLLILATLSFAQGPQTLYVQSIGPVSNGTGCTASTGTSTSASIAPCGGQGGMFQNSLVSNHNLTWTVTATVSSCTVQLETSSNGTTWSLMTGSVAQTCTSSGSYNVSAQSAAYVRFNITALTTSGSGAIVVTYTSAVPTLQTVSCSFTGSATSAAIQTVAQTSSCTGLANNALVFPVSVPAPTSLCPPTSYRVTADNTLSIYFTVLTAGACTPASGTYVMGVVK